MSQLHRFGALGSAVGTEHDLLHEGERAPANGRTQRRSPLENGVVAGAALLESGEHLRGADEILPAAGAVEAAVSALAIRDGVSPPTIHYETPDPACDLDYVPNASRRRDVRFAISNSFGFGGQNAVVAFRRA